MTAAAMSAPDDQALAWLDRLLDMPADMRSTALRALQSENALLHARVERMLRAAQTSASSRPLIEPVQAGYQSADATRSPAIEAGQTVAGYRLIQELGRGGMAVVWRAERADGAVKRQVALKMPARRLDTPADQARFERERDVLAMLNHPGIARLYDVALGEAGQAFIVLELVEGTPVTLACDARQSTVRQRLSLFLRILSAVEYAHQHLVVHRDLKPSNILVDAQGLPKLLDFGIAKLLGASTSSDLTCDNGCALTPRYAAPEQVDNRAISTATDIYALGVLLHELLTGTLPYGDIHASAAEAVNAVLHAAPRRPSQALLTDEHLRARGCRSAAELRTQLAGDLDTIVLKALRKAPSERYGSVERFADDIQRFLDHRPIAARRPTLAHRTRLLLQRHRVASAAGLAGLMVVAGLAWMAVDQYRQSQASGLRAAAVREFMFDVFEGAEPDEFDAAASPGSAKSHLIDLAVDKANTQFQSEPRLRGEVLSELGLVYGRLGLSDRSLDLLGRGLALLESNAPGSDPQLNKARARLADALWSAGQPERAATLAEQALSGCERGADCAKPRYYARNVLVNRARVQGRMKDAMSLMQLGVEDCETAFGRRHAETAMAWESLAIVARQSGDLAVASQALGNALDIGETIALRQTDRIELSRTAALLSLDEGRLDDAGHRLAALLRQDGTPAAERALQWRLQATLEVAQGQARQALASALHALEMSAADDAKVQALLAHQAHARAAALLGMPEAASEMEWVVRGLQDMGYQPASMEVLRARRMVADVQIRTGHSEDALPGLLDVAAQQQRQQDSQAVEWAQTLDLIGCVRRTQGQWAQASELHAQARQVLQARLPADHYLRHRNALYALAADLAGHPTADTQMRFVQAARAVARALPPDSVWHDRLLRTSTVESLPLL